MIFYLMWYLKKMQIWKYFTMSKIAVPYLVQVNILKLNLLKFIISIIKGERLF